MKVLGWKIWYGDGTIWWHGPSHNDGHWTNAPNDGIVEVTLYFDQLTHGTRYREFLAGQDYYFSDGEQLFGCNNDNLATNRKRYPDCTFKRGMWFANEVWEPIHDRIILDMEI